MRYYPSAEVSLGSASDSPGRHISNTHVPSPQTHSDAGPRAAHESEASIASDSNSTIHESQLDKYPGEFHHCGDGSVKPGPDNSGHQTSRLGGKAYNDERAVEDEDGDDENEVVSTEYARSHPNVKWVHRGNGRYIRISSRGTSAPVSASYPSTLSSQCIGNSEDGI